MQLAVIGTGLMGNPFAKKLLEKGFNVNVYNRTQVKTENLKELGAKVYDSPNQIVKESDVIILFLSNYDAIYEVLVKSNIGSFEGKTVIQMGTIASDDSKEMEKRITRLNGEYFEAPVLGSIKQIENNALIVLVGSSKEQFEKYFKTLSVCSKKTLHIGNVGSAAAMKLALNQLIISETIAFSMSLGFVKENNLNTNMFMEILKDSALFAPTFEKKLGNMLNRDFDNPNFPLKHLLKDLNLMLGEFAEKNINTTTLKGARKILIEAIELGFGEYDYSALYNAIHKKGD